MNHVVPLHIFTGFLGVGKTTAILRLIKNLNGREFAAVIVNERGEVGIDGVVMQAFDQKLEVREVTGGCICCTAGIALEQALKEILENVGPDRIFVEPSGIAKPGEINDLLQRTEFPREIEIRPIVSIVDPASFLKPQMMKLPIYRDQVEAGDILVANRCDLADSAVMEAFHEKAKALFPPKRAILTTSFGAIPEEIIDMKRTTTTTRDRLYFPSLHPDHSEGHSGKQKHEMFQDMGWLWPEKDRFDHRSLSELFESLAASKEGMNAHIERCKGVFHTDQGWYLFEIASGAFHSRLIQYRGDNRCQVILSNPEDVDHSHLLHLLQSCMQRTQQ